MDVLISFTKVSEDRELESLVIALEVCLGLCDLSPEEVRAIGEHEHMPDIIAAALGTELLHSETGLTTIRDMIVDEMRTAVRRRDIAGARNLVGTLRHFLRDHPEAAFQPRAA
jgi:hypothetical protein